MPVTTEGQRHAAATRGDEAPQAQQALPLPAPRAGGARSPPTASPAWPLARGAADSPSPAPGSRAGGSAGGLGWRELLRDADPAAPRPGPLRVDSPLYKSWAHGGGGGILLAGAPDAAAGCNSGASGGCAGTPGGAPSEQLRPLGSRQQQSAGATIVTPPPWRAVTAGWSSGRWEEGLGATPGPWDGCGSGATAQQAPAGGCANDAWLRAHFPGAQPPRREDAASLRAWLGAQLGGLLQQLRGQQELAPAEISSAPAGTAACRDAAGAARAAPQGPSAALQGQAATAGDAIEDCAAQLLALCTQPGGGLDAGTLRQQELVLSAAFGELCRQVKGCGWHGCRAHPFASLGPDGLRPCERYRRVRA